MVKALTQSIATFNERLCSLRLARGLSMSDLAQAANVHEVTIRNLKAGRRAGLDFVAGVRLARALGVDAAELAGLSEN